MLVFGFTGTFGAGKGAAISILTERFGAVAYSTSEEVSEECARRGLPTDRGSKTVVSNDTRRKLGSGIFSERVVEKIFSRKPLPELVCVDALRTLGEVEVLKKKFGRGFKLVAIDAPVELRYKRVQSRLRDKHDFKPFEQFAADEQRELTGARHEWKQDLGAVMGAADYRIINDGSVKELKKKIGNMLAEIREKK